MNEYACRFFFLLEQANRLDAIESLNQLQITTFANQKAPQQKKIVKDYQKRAHGRVEVTPAIIEQDSNRLMAILGIKQK